MSASLDPEPVCPPLHTMGAGGLYHRMGTTMLKNHKCCWILVLSRSGSELSRRFVNAPKFHSPVLPLTLTYSRRTTQVSVASLLSQGTDPQDPGGLLVLILDSLLWDGRLETQVFTFRKPVVQPEKQETPVTPPPGWRWEEGTSQM